VWKGGKSDETEAIGRERTREEEAKKISLLKAEKHLRNSFRIMAFIREL